MAEKKQIILNCEELETRCAYLKNGKLEEYELERPGEEIAPGSIYLAKIMRHEPSLEAVFANIGADKNAFMHYRDMLPASYDMLDNIREIDKQEEELKAEEKTEQKQKRGKTAKNMKEQPRKLLALVSEKLRTFMGRADKGARLRQLEEKLHSGKITIEDIPKVFPCGSEVLVQVTKGPIGTKGARVTTNITLPGRYLVLLPYSKHLGLSSRIDNKKERERLRKILKALPLPEGMGLICRTVGEGRKEIFFQRDLEMLLELWSKIEAALEQPNAPKLVLSEPTLLERTVRDSLTDEIDEIVVDDKNCYKFLQDALKKFVGNDFQTKVVLHKKAEPVFDRYGVTEQAAGIFNRVVTLPGGGYLCIDETEALIAIDVNSGKSKGANQAELLLKTNIEAAEEVARQLRLRNIGGQVVVDFIDMNSASDREKVNQAMRKFLDADRAKTRALPLSKFGLMEMTRQREHESVKDAVYDLCPYCNGSGHVKSAISMSVEIQRSLKELLRKRSGKRSKTSVRVIMNPAVLARLKNDDAELLREMEEKYGNDLQFRADPTIHIEEFKLVEPDTGRTLN